MFREAYYKKRDHVSDDYQLIYKAPMELTVAGCKHVATASLAIIGAIMAYKYVANIPILDLTTEIEFGSGSLMSSGFELTIFAGAFFLFNATILYACSKYPLRIYKHKNRSVRGLVLPFKKINVFTFTFQLCCFL